MTRSWLVSSLISLLFATACGPSSGSKDDAAKVRGTIVGGEKTTDWPGVGALVADVPGYGYMGPFCTGTLIAPSWVLTAAHCISSYEGMPILPFFVKFYIGTDANASWGGMPSTGQLVQADEFFPHPNYDASMLTVGHDIGLVRLKTEVTGIPLVPINRRSLRGRHLGSAVRYVGFGVSDGLHQTGGGIKRETTMPMTWFDSGAYYTEPAGSGTCNGDSGGPGFLQMDPDGSWSQIGVVSAGTESPGSPGDPCLTGMGIYTRVDTHVSWIAEVTGITFPSCAQGFCLCDEACRPDGGCDDSLCRTRTCLQSLACLSGCPSGDDACRMDCRVVTRPEDEVVFDKISYCIDTKCTNSVDVLGCARSACAAHLNECVAHSGVYADCATYASCRETCQEGESLCVFACDSEATKEARDLWAAADSCLKQADCGVVVTSLATQDPCVREHCLGELESCFPPPPCDPLGGTCAEGTACRILPDGRSRCVVSEGHAEGDACDPSALAPCADGLWCDDDGSSAACRRTCLEDADCDGADRCFPRGPDRPGVCLPLGPVHEGGVTDVSAADNGVWDAAGPAGGEVPSGDSSEGEAAGVGNGSGGGCSTRPAGSIPLFLVIAGAACLAALRGTPSAPRS